MQPQRKKVFVIHGRDNAVYEELVKLIVSLGLEVIRFESVSNSLGGTPLVRKVVENGIAQADAIVALFTPDEHAGLYDMGTGRLMTADESSPRWQSRANVIFEAGLAFGQTRIEPILAVFGSDVSRPSDLGGLHFVTLSAPDGKQNLRDRLDKVVGPLPPAANDWALSRDTGDFRSLARRRWKFYDEIDELIRILSNHPIPKKAPSVSLLNVIRQVSELDPARDWTIVGADEFMQVVRGIFDNQTTDEAYWWFVVYGFIRFNDIDEWGIRGSTPWATSSVYAKVSPRGAALLERLRAMAH
jgi:predicted nucleotide-binding protein with TIR-like domain